MIKSTASLSERAGDYYRHCLSCPACHFTDPPPPLTCREGCRLYDRAYPPIKLRGTP